MFCQSVKYSNNYLETSTFQIDTNYVVPYLPNEIWNSIFNYLELKKLNLPIEHRIYVLTQSLEKNEGKNLLIGEKIPIYRKDFLHMVIKVYNLALCCKAFYVETKSERTLLIAAAAYARIYPAFFDELYLPQAVCVSGPPPDKVPSFERFDEIIKLNSSTLFDNYLPYERSLDYKNYMNLLAKVPIEKQSWTIEFKPNFAAAAHQFKPNFAAALDALAHQRLLIKSDYLLYKNNSELTLNSIEDTEEESTTDSNDETTSGYCLIQ